MLRVFLAVSLSLMCLSGSLLAQDTAQEAEQSRLEVFLQEQLSSAGRDIRIEGFRGALSSAASLDRLTISDNQGAWLVLEGAVLNWSRAALLSGRVEVERLAAERLHILRRPAPGPTQAPSPVAEPFSLPDLPVSINLGALTVQDLQLDAPVLGQSVRFSLEGSAKLAGGAGEARLALNRLDGPIGQIALHAAFAPEEGIALNLSFDEAQGGLISTLAGLPGTPALQADITGAGPLDNFAADITLRSDGQPRLTGTFARNLVEGAVGTHTISLDIAGDLSPLFVPEYRDFLGDALEVQLDLRTGADGAVSLPLIRLAARSLMLEGRAELGADRWPRALSVRATLTDPEGGPVRLPISGEPVTLVAADVQIDYDAARGPDWLAQVVLEGLDSQAATLRSARLDGVGTIRPPENGTLGEADLQLTVTTEGLTLSDPSLAQALGTAPQIATRLLLTPTQPEPLRLEDLILQTGAATLSGRAAWQTEGARAAVTLSASLPRLSRVAGLAPLPGLSGRAQAELAGFYAPLSGAFDLQGTATTQALRTGQTQLDALIGGAGRVTFDIARDTEGTTLRTLLGTFDGLRVDGRGAINPEATDLRITLDLPQIQRLTREISGSARALATLTRSGPDLPYDIRLTATGPAEANVQVTGQIEGDFATANLNAAVRAPAALANSFISPQRVQGQISADLRLRGPLSPKALSGQFGLTDGALSVPTVPLNLRALSVTGQIANGQVSLSGGASNLPSGQVDLTGRLSYAPTLDLDLNVALQALRIVRQDQFDTTVSGQISLSRMLAPSAQISGALTLEETEVTLSPGLAPGGSVLPDLRHVGASGAVNRTLSAAGLLGGPTSTGPTRAIGLNLTISAPRQLAIRGCGLDAELGGDLTVGGTTVQPIPTGGFELLRGRLEFLGKRLDLVDGQVTLRGGLTPVVDLTAVSTSNGTELVTRVTGPANAPVVEISATPDLPEDQALAQFLFGRGIGQLSALQAAQLAAAVASLRGGCGSFLGGLRASTGLDDLDVTTPDGGATTVRAGRYISDKVYSDVSVDSTGKSEIRLNIDLTDTLTLRGTVDSVGEGGIGFGYETDF